MFSFASITDLINYIQAVCDRDNCLHDMSVTGEISGFKKYPSGHCYFSLKDSESTISCVMFGFYASNLDFQPADGLKVVVRCKAGIYGSSGKFQLYCSSMTQLGKGDLREQYKKLYAKLDSEGLFSPDYKKQIPILPKKIGVITSIAGAVIHDIITTLNSRNPYYDLVIYPSSVQGQTAPAEIIAGIDFFENSSDINIDVLIIARGGGSYEDLYCFNDEALARRIFACRIPVISAVGHETDFTICDYVSDLRVPTPTAAAEVVLPRFDNLQYTIASLRNELDNSVYNYVSSQKNRLFALKNHKALSGPEYRVKLEFSKLDGLMKNLVYLMNTKINSEQQVLDSIMTKLDLTSPLNVIRRGYSITYDSEGNIVSSGKDIKVNDKVVIQLNDSKITATVNDVSIKGEE
ncbi:MAG: exodeoxyribonuclease VII large subunit [Clostridia bacterium]|nr:exodeoxyribonuclease VII large subunit [Clostridia bacterium]